MLLSVICIVLVIAAVVAVGIYFGVIDKDKGVEGNYDDITTSIKNSYNDVKDKFKN